VGRNAKSELICPLGDDKQPLVHVHHVPTNWGTVAGFVICAALPTTAAAVAVGNTTGAARNAASRHALRLSAAPAASCVSGTTLRTTSPPKPADLRRPDSLPARHTPRRPWHGQRERATSVGDNGTHGGRQRFSGNRISRCTRPWHAQRKRSNSVGDNGTHGGRQRISSNMWWRCTRVEEGPAVLWYRTLWRARCDAAGRGRGGRSDVAMKAPVHKWGAGENDEIQGGRGNKVVWNARQDTRDGQRVEHQPGLCWKSAPVSKDTPVDRCAWCYLQRAQAPTQHLATGTRKRQSFVCSYDRAAREIMLAARVRFKRSRSAAHRHGCLWRLWGCRWSHRLNETHPYGGCRGGGARWRPETCLCGVCGGSRAGWRPAMPSARVAAVRCAGAVPTRNPSVWRLWGVWGALPIRNSRVWWLWGALGAVVTKIPSVRRLWGIQGALGPALCACGSWDVRGALWRPEIRPCGSCGERGSRGHSGRLRGTPASRGGWWGWRNCDPISLCVQNVWAAKRIDAVHGFHIEGLPCGHARNACASSVIVLPAVENQRAALEIHDFHWPCPHLHLLEFKYGLHGRTRDPKSNSVRM